MEDGAGALPACQPADSGGASALLIRISVNNSRATGVLADVFLCVLGGDGEAVKAPAAPGALRLQTGIRRFASHLGTCALRATLLTLPYPVRETEEEACRIVQARGSGAKEVGISRGRSGVGARRLSPKWRGGW